MDVDQPFVEASGADGGVLFRGVLADTANAGRSESSVDLARVASILTRWWWLIAGVALATGAVAFAASLAMPKEFESESRVLVGSLTEADYDQQLAYQQLAQTYVGVATTNPVLERVAQRAGIGGDPKRLASQIDVRAPLGQNIVRVSVRAPTADEAARIANAAAVEITALAGAGALQVAVVQPAVPPVGPSSPRVTFNAAVATVLGLALGAGLAFLLDRRRRRRVRPVGA